MELPVEDVEGMGEVEDEGAVPVQQGSVVEEVGEGETQRMGTVRPIRRQLVAPLLQAGRGVAPVGVVLGRGEGFLEGGGPDSGSESGGRSGAEGEGRHYAAARENGRSHLPPHAVWRV